MCMWPRVVLASAIFSPWWKPAFLLPSVLPSSLGFWGRGQAALFNPTVQGRGVSLPYVSGASTHTCRERGERERLISSHPPSVTQSQNTTFLSSFSPLQEMYAATSCPRISGAWGGVWSDRSSRCACRCMHARGQREVFLVFANFNMHTSGVPRWRCMPGAFLMTYHEAIVTSTTTQLFRNFTQARAGCTTGASSATIFHATRWQGWS